MVAVCDNAAAETCRIWPEGPVSVHWGHIDPAAVAGSAVETRTAFDRVYRERGTKISALVAADPTRLERNVLVARLEEIGALGFAD